MAAAVNSTQATPPYNSICTMILETKMECTLYRGKITLGNSTYFFNSRFIEILIYYSVHSFKVINSVIRLYYHS